MAYMSLERSSKIPTAVQTGQDSETKACQTTVPEGCPQCSSSHITCPGKGDYNQLLLSLHLQRVTAVTKSMWEGKCQISMLKRFLELDNFIRHLLTLYFTSPCFYHSIQYVKTAKAKGQQNNSVLTELKYRMRKKNFKFAENLGGNKPNKKENIFPCL